MTNKTLIPALRAKVGDWNYYICIMKYAQVAKEIDFAHELHGNAELSDLMQRGLSARTKDIVEYLLKSKHRFLGSLVVAAYGGDPSFIPVKMDETEELIEGLDDQFGVLTFDGTQSYFALDGQHRLKAIKDALKKNADLGSEDISVIMVSHYDTVKGKQRTRRLFSNINRNAKATSHSENIALDEDDGFAILTRRFIREDAFLSVDQRVHTLKRSGNQDGELSIATTIPVGSKMGFTSIKQLYEMLSDLGFSLNNAMRNAKVRPSDVVLDASYDLLSIRLKDLFDACGNIRVLLTPLDDVRYLRKDINEAHPFMRGLIQRAMTQVLGEICKQELLTWDEAIKRVSKLKWKITEAPWLAVVTVDGQKYKMRTSRENKELLHDLLRVHLSPNSKQEIKRARKAYNDIKGEKYPITEEELAKNIKT